MEVVRWDSVVDNISIDLKETGCDGVGWTHLTQYEAQGRALGEYGSETSCSIKSDFQLYQKDFNAWRWFLNITSVPGHKKVVLPLKSIESVTCIQFQIQFIDLCFVILHRYVST
jgi:hypothetical protein